MTKIQVKSRAKERTRDYEEEIAEKLGGGVKRNAIRKPAEGTQGQTGTEPVGAWKEKWRIQTDDKFDRKRRLFTICYAGAEACENF